MNYTKPQIRELTVEFYSSVDPNGLNSGVDINGIVEWCMAYGVDEMDKKLMAKYGRGFDYSILQKPAMSAMKRISMMPMNAQASNRNKQNLSHAEKLEAFYGKHDPSKLGTLQNYIDWINYHGYDEFNKKLMEKYGEDLDTLKPAGAGGYRPTPPPPSSASGAGGYRATPPPPPPPSYGGGSGEKPNLSAPIGIILHQKLEKFYLKHEPDKIQDLKAIVDWALFVGEDELNDRLVQIFGEGLDDVGTDDTGFGGNGSGGYSPRNDNSAAVGGFKPTPPARKPSGGNTTSNYDSGGVDYDNGGVSGYDASGGYDASNGYDDGGGGGGGGGGFLADINRGVKLNKAPPPPSDSSRAPPANSAEGELQSVAAQAAMRLAAKAQAPKQPKRTAAEGACSNYKLDMNGTTFGVCECGFNKASHGGTRPISARRNPGVNPADVPAAWGTTRPSAFGAVLKPAGPAPTARPHTSACSNYSIDMKATTFGLCKCGFPKADHGQKTQNQPAYVKR